MRSYRYASHAAVLVIATVISSYTAVDLRLSMRPTGTLNAEANAGGRVGDVALGRDSTIIKPIAIPTSALPNRKPIRYSVRAGDTLDGIAQSFGLPLRDVTWSNPGLRQPLKTGQVLELPPVPGAVVVVKTGDSPASLASRFGVDATTILGFNDIGPSQLTAGMTLVVPVDSKTSPDLRNGLPADPLSPAQFVCPIQGAPIIQKFGPTSFAVELPYDGYPHFHTGYDILAGFGTPIDAAAGGTVTAAGYADYFGNRVEITDSYGLVEIYAHMESVAANVGDQIQQGQVIGFVGSTGLSIGAHLHFQLEVGGVPTDPGNLIGCS